MVGICRAFSTSFWRLRFHGGKHAAHHAAVAQMAHQRARIDIGDYRDAVLAARNSRASSSERQLLVMRGKLAHHQTLDVRARGFVVGGVGAVVPDLRIGQDDDLAGIGRIGEDFLVAGDGGIEDDFAGSFGGRTKTPALEDGSVFQGEDCRWQLDCPPRDWIKPILAGAGWAR